MSRSYLVIAAVLTACATNVSVEPGSAADPKAEPAAMSEGSGVLLASFDPERIAPAGPTAAGHDHHEGHDHGAPSGQPEAGTTYTCAHHPEVVSDKPGKCPKCGMDLTPKKPSPKQPANPHEGHGAH